MDRLYAFEKQRERDIEMSTFWHGHKLKTLYMGVDQKKLYEKIVN